MKNIYTYITLVLMTICTSCSDDILDKEPIDLITDANLWESPELVKAYINGIYADMAILYADNSQDFSKKSPWQATEMLSIADEGSSDWGGHGNFSPKHGEMVVTSTFNSWWGYSQVRKMNELITRLPEEEGLTDEEKDAAISETRFLRAYSYFHMAKLFGGVPIITIPQAIDDPEEEIYPARNKEEEVYDFVLSELAEILSDLPEHGTIPENEFGRPSQITALALTSRVALYAASIATYGTVQLDGLVGIPTAKATSYWQTSYDASLEVMNFSIANNASLALYNKYPEDKTKNYRELFLEARNSEVIWAKSYLGAPGSPEGPMNIWGLCQSPRNLHPWVGGQDCAVYLEMANEYENADGSSGALNEALINSGLVTIDQIFGQKEPRFFASLYTEGTDFYGRTVRMYNGILDEGGNLVTSGNYKDLKVAPGNNQTGQDNGFGILKYTTISEWPQSTDWILIRYAEVLLNHAEAAFELGQTSDALDAINQIRERAGVPAHTGIDMDKIRHERKIELAFESHRYWDLRRWRTATDDLSKTFSTLHFVLDYNSYVADPSNIKYQVRVVPAESGKECIFNEEHYYFPITPGRIANNPNLLENPNY